MGEKTKIGWCDSTDNFWEGCTECSPGCANCYAKERDKRHMIEDVGHWGKGAPRRKVKGAVSKALAMNRKPWICDDCGGAFANEHTAHVPLDKSPVEVTGDLCIASAYHRRRIFSLSLGDWLDLEVLIEWLAEMLDTVRLCDEVIWILCTKRPELFPSRLEAVMEYLACEPELNEPLYNWILDWHNGYEGLIERKQKQNIIVLASVENQPMANERIPALLKIPAGCLGLSVEPLLEAIDLEDIHYAAGKGEHHFNCLSLEGDNPEDDTDFHGRTIGWVIFGGESGPGARPCNVDWIRAGVKQCQAAGVRTFVKQLGTRAVRDIQDARGHYLGFEGMDLKEPKGADMAEWPEDLRIQEWPDLPVGHEYKAVGRG